MPYNGAWETEVLTRSDLWQWRRVHGAGMIEPTRLPEAAGYCRCFLTSPEWGLSVVIGSLRHAFRRRGSTRWRDQDQADRANSTPDQLRMIPDFLGHGAEAYGFRGKAWTTTRIAKSHRRRILMFPFTRPMFRDCFIACIGRLKCLVLRWRMQRDEGRNRKVAENCLAATGESKGSTRTQNPCFYGRIGLLSAAGRRANLCAAKANLRSSRSGKLATICR